MTTAGILRFKFAFAAFDRWKVKRAVERFEESCVELAHLPDSPPVRFTDFAKKCGDFIIDTCRLPRHHGHPLNPSRHKPKRKKK